MSQTPVPEHDTMSMPPAAERSLASKMLVPLISLVVVASIAIGFAYWWTNRATDGAVAVSSDPKEAVIQGIERLIASKDGAFEFTAAKETFEAVDDRPTTQPDGLAPISEANGGLYDGVQVRVSGVFAMTGPTTTQSSLDFDITGKELGFQMMTRSFGNDIFLQLAKFDVKQGLPVNLSPVLGTWININVQQALNDFGAGLGAVAGSENEGILKMIEAQPTRFIVTDSAVYGKIMGDVLRRHDVMTSTKVSENAYRLEERPGITEQQTEALVRDVVKSFVQQYLRDVDAAIVATTKAGDTKGVEQLRTYRADLVKEVGEDGSKGADEVIKSMEQDGEAATAQVDKGQEKTEFIVQVNQRTGVADALVIQPVTSYMGKDLRAVQPMKLTFTKLNTGIRVERPAAFKTVYEMLPIFMGMLSGAAELEETKE